MYRPPEYRDSPIAEASRWVSRITSLSLTMVLPAIGGYYLDRYMGSRPWFLIAGAGLGGSIAFLELLVLVQKASKKRDVSSRPSPQREKPREGDK